MSYELVHRGLHTCETPYSGSYYERPGAIVRCSECGQHWRYERTWYLVMRWQKVDGPDPINAPEGIG